jgi:hypothetical protein
VGEWTKILKFNPNHDAKGQFSSGGGAHGETTAKAKAAHIAKVKASDAYKGKEKFRDVYEEAMAHDDSDARYEAFKEGDADLHKATQAQWDALKGKEQQTLVDYTENSTRLNGYVTGHYNHATDDTGDFASKEEAEGHYAQRAKELDATLQKTEIPENLITYRAMDTRSLGKVEKATMNDLVGREFTDPAYGSTSIDRKVAENFLGFEDGSAGRVLLQVNARKGRKGFYIGNSPERTAFSGESELLVPRGSKYKITRVLTKTRYLQGSKPGQTKPQTYHVLQVDLL